MVELPISNNRLMDFPVIRVLLILESLAIIHHNQIHRSQISLCLSQRVGAPFFARRLAGNQHEVEAAEVRVVALAKNSQVLSLIYAD